MYPQQNFDSFQQQLNDLQRSYTQLGKTFPAQQQRPKREIHKEDGIDEAKKWAKENLQPGESEAIFDENKNLFCLCARRHGQVGGKPGGSGRLISFVGGAGFLRSPFSKRPHPSA